MKQFVIFKVFVSVASILPLERFTLWSRITVPPVYFFSKMILTPRSHQDPPLSRYFLLSVVGNNVIF